jgi:hypothetical protein
MIKSNQENFQKKSNSLFRRIGEIGNERMEIGKIPDSPGVEIFANFL